MYVGVSYLPRERGVRRRESHLVCVGATRARRPVQSEASGFAKEETSGCVRAAPLLNRLEHACVGGRGEPSYVQSADQSGTFAPLVPEILARGETTGHWPERAPLCGVDEECHIVGHLLRPDEMAARWTWDNMQRRGEMCRNGSVRLGALIMAKRARGYR